MVSQQTYNSVPVAVILPNVRAYGAVVHDLAISDLISQTELTVQAPLYKGTPEIKEALKNVGSALEKFEVYIHLAILNEAVRVQMAQAFRKRYLARHPRSEGSDIFKASGDVLSFAFTMHQPLRLEKMVNLKGAISTLPHDKEVLYALRDNENIDRRHLRGDLRIFLDNVYNPRRRNDPEVKKLLVGDLAEDPVILELETTGACPGLFIRVIGATVSRFGGAMALLSG